MSTSIVTYEDVDNVPSSYLRRVFSQVAIQDNGDRVNLSLQRTGYMDIIQLRDHLQRPAPMALAHSS